MIISSIRGRIQIWHTTLLALITSGLSCAFYFHEKEILIRLLDNELISRITPILPLHLPAPGINRPNIETNAPNRQSGSPTSETDRPPAPWRNRPDPWASNDAAENTTDPTSRPPPRQRDHGPGAGNREDRIAAFNDQLAQKNLYFFVLSPDKTIFARSESAPDSLPTLPAARFGKIQYTRENYREVAHTAQRGFIVIVGGSLENIHRELVPLRWKLALVTLSVSLFGFIVGWFLVGRSLQPIQSISTTAEKITRGDLSKRIDESDTDNELGQLAKMLNEMFDKLEMSFEQQVRFTADASHELRTPISVILAKCQFALLRERSPEKYRDALATCQDSAQHIRGLVQSLLELAKVDSGEFQVFPQGNDLAQLAKQGSDFLAPLAEEKQIKLFIQLSTARCDFDYDRMKQVLINLLSNAIKYTPDGGQINIDTSTHAQFCRLTISDTGQGIEESELPYIFDRFYRSDEGRSGEQKSTGLGLAITKAIVEAHGGFIQAKQNHDQGTRFIVEIPRKNS